MTRSTFTHLLAGAVGGAVGTAAQSLYTTTIRRSAADDAVSPFGPGWTSGILAGAAYGGLRGRAEAPDALGAIALGASLWALRDGAAWTSGETTPADTLYRGGGHAVYGLATTATTQTLLNVVAPRRSRLSLAWGAATSLAGTYLRWKAAKKTAGLAASAAKKTVGRAPKLAGKAVATAGRAGLQAGELALKAKAIKRVAKLVS